MPTQYQVFGNTGNGSPIDYATVLATVSGLSWTPPALNAGSDWSFGVRAVDSTSGLSESNVDAKVRIVLDANGKDLTALPAQPVILGLQVVNGNGCRLDWSWTDVRFPKPETFQVFTSTTGSIDPSSSPVAVIPGQRAKNYGVNLATLPSGTVTLGIVAVVKSVRSLVTTTTVTISATPPSPPESLVATTIDQRGS